MELDDQEPTPRRRRRQKSWLRGESDRRAAERAAQQIAEARANGVTVDAATGFTVLHLPAAAPERSRSEAPVRRRQPLHGLRATYLS